MGVIITVTVLILVDVHLIDIKYTAMCILLYDPNANLESRPLLVCWGRHDLGIVSVAIVDLDVAIKSRRSLVHPVALSLDGIKREVCRQVDTDRYIGLIKVNGVSIIFVVNTSAESYGCSSARV
jgi:hypothetical protein